MFNIYSMNASKNDKYDQNQYDRYKTNNPVKPFILCKTA